MRQRSISGPIVLIGLGFLFLVNNIRPDFSIWRNLWRFWPFLLIALGGIRLAEVLMWGGPTASTDPRPRRGGGLTGLIIFLCIVFWAMGHSRNTIHIGNWNNANLELFGDSYEYPVALKGPADGVKLVILEGLRGNVTVTGGDGEEYSAEGRRSVRASSKSEADQLERRYPVKFVRQGDQLVLRMDDSQSSGDKKISTEIDLKIPKGANLESRGRSGDVTVSSLDGAVSIATDRGDVRLNGIGGNVKLTVAHSNLIRVADSTADVTLGGKGSDVQMSNIRGQVTVDGSYSGTLEFKNLAKPLRFQSPQTDMRLEKLAGSLTMDLGDLRVDHATGPIRFHTKSRDVHMEDFTGPVDIDITERGDVDVATGETPLEQIDIHTRNGNIELGLPEKGGFHLSATTRQGEARNDFGQTVKLETFGRSATLESANSGGVPVTAKTDRGAVAVKKTSSSRD
jgi:hypothetical protein